MHTRCGHDVLVISMAPPRAAVHDGGARDICHVMAPFYALVLFSPMEHPRTHPRAPQAPRGHRHTDAPNSQQSDIPHAIPCSSLRSSASPILPPPLSRHIDIAYSQPGVQGELARRQGD